MYVLDTGVRGTHEQFRQPTGGQQGQVLEGATVSLATGKVSLVMRC